MLRSLAILALLAGLLSTTGCSLCLYCDTTRPFTTDFKDTPVHQFKNDGQTKHFTYSFLRFAWQSNGLGDIANRFQMDEIYYADIERWIIAFGIWRQYKIHVYGK